VLYKMKTWVLEHAAAYIRLVHVDPHSKMEQYARMPTLPPGAYGSRNNREAPSYNRNREQGEKSSMREELKDLGVH
jgi:hypothetical protein